MGHLLGHGEFSVDCSIGRTAAHGEIVRACDDIPRINSSTPENEIRWTKAVKLAFGGVVAASGDLADFAKRVRVEECGDALACVQLAPGFLSGKLFRPAHGLSRRRATL